MKETIKKTIKCILTENKYDVLLTAAYLFAGFKCLTRKERVTKKDFSQLLGFLFTESCLKIYYKWKMNNKDREWR